MFMNRIVLYMLVEGEVSRYRLTLLMFLSSIWRQLLGLDN